MHGEVYTGEAVNWDASLNRGLVSWWLALPDQQRGNVFRDLCSRYHGTLTNGPTWGGSKGRPGAFGSLAFDATDDHIADIAYAPGSGGLTIACRTFGLNHAIQFRPFFGLSNGGTTSLQFWSGSATPSSQIHFYGVAAGATTGSAAPSTALTGDDIHVGTLDNIAGGTMRYYRNGVELANDASSGNLSAINTIHIGRGRVAAGTFAYLNITSPWFAIWNRELSASEVAVLNAEDRLGNPNRLNWVRRQYVFDAGGGGGGLSIPIAAYHYNHRLGA
jgi:hypothetical protein